MSLLSTSLNIAIEGALKSGHLLLEWYGKLEHIQHKQYEGDLVTEADIASEKALVTFFKEQTPTFGILGEESGQYQVEAPWQWVVDPLDGTTNFAHKHPMFCVSIALVYQGKPQLGVIYSPIHRELYHAKLGEGAFLNDQPLKVSSTDALQNSLLGSGFPYDRKINPDNNYRAFCHLTQLTQGVRRAGSAALDLAYVAAGRLDGYWERGLKPWDLAAGFLLVKEAGGVVSDYYGKALETICDERVVTSNGHIHQELIAELQTTLPEESMKF